ncbi:hypothetical protein [Euzebya pacifica]|uniref:hypothetical protein n=1 Tax=Euzebya pacifica TaxID=1608957 RepID=UPI0030F9EF72
MTAVDRATALDRAERLVLGWARVYTRGLSADAAERRLGELQSDCHEQRCWGDEVGASPVAVATSMVARTLAGMPADLLGGEPHTRQHGIGRASREARRCAW